MAYTIKEIQPTIKHKPPNGVTIPMAEAGKPVSVCVPIINSEPENITMPVINVIPAILSHPESECCFDSEITKSVASM